MTKYTEDDLNDALLCEGCISMDQWKEFAEYLIEYCNELEKKLTPRLVKATLNKSSLIIQFAIKPSEDKLSYSDSSAVDYDIIAIRILGVIEG